VVEDINRAKHKSYQGAKPFAANEAMEELDCKLFSAWKVDNAEELRRIPVPEGNVFEVPSPFPSVC
jgi:hypothetical protein